MDAEKHTRERIIVAAIALFFEQGVKKTTMEEVALQAGLTRVTVYRHFGGKKQLVRAAFLRVLAAFQRAQEAVCQEPGQDVETLLDHIGLELASLPPGDLPTRLAELGRLYPDVWQEFRQARLEAVSKIFECLFEAAGSQGLLRQELRREVVQAYFMRAVVNVMEDQSLVALNLSPAEIYATVKTIFLHGILTSVEAQ